ncbi:MAG: inositol monophosphatase family protein [Thiogranum sp.]|nr:inositol monophosphatase family protein [Thiogranum sp.]
MLPENAEQLAAIVRDIADRELPSRFCCKCGTRKTDGSLLTEADVIMQNSLANALRDRWPEIDILGEEMDEAAQLQALRHLDTGLWCIDPVDGTSNFSLGVPYYAVSVALLRGGEIHMGVVYDPSRKECFAAARGHGAWLNGQRLASRPAAPLSEGVALIDLKRLPRELASRLASDPPYQSQRSFGAVALDWCWLAAGRCHVYLHGQQKLWDYAAGCLILQEAGGQAVTLQGEPVFVPTLEPRSAAAALDPEIFRQWVAWLGIRDA